MRWAIAIRDEGDLGRETPAVSRLYRLSREWPL